MRVFPVSQFFASGRQSISFSISPSNEYAGLFSFGMDYLDLLAVQGTHKSLLPHHSSKALILLCSVQFSSVAQSCPTLCDPMKHSMPGLPVHHQIWEFTQTDVHWDSDAIQPSHPLSSPSPPASKPSQHQSFSMNQFFTWGGQSTGVSASASFPPKKSQGWSPSEWTAGSPCSPRDSQESSLTPQFKSINSSALSLLHSPTLTSIHDHWKNHSLD